MSRNCKNEGCNKRATFNFKGESKGLFCKIHSKEGMIGVTTPTCQHEDCNKYPCFNNEGEKKPLYCQEHAKTNMIDIKHKRCIHEGCNKYPCFNNEGEKKPLYCQEHAKTNMIDIKNKRCIHEGCNTHPNFNYKGETKPLYCKEHAKINMIDIKNKTCIHENCSKQRHFNYNGETKPLYCKQHSKTNMVDIKSKRCLSELCDTRVHNKKYDWYCLRCYMYLFPDRPVARNYKTKEYAVVEYIKTKFPNFTWTADKTILYGCSRRRPDLLLDLGYQVIIIEIDENQHQEYDCSCNNRRTMEISQDVGHRPVVFIRFNPDEYIKGDQKITSCWGVNKNGICVVKKCKQKEWTDRLSVLESQVEYWINPENQTDKTVETVELFYDQAN